MKGCSQTPSQSRSPASAQSPSCSWSLTDLAELFFSFEFWSNVSVKAFSTKLIRFSIYCISRHWMAWQHNIAMSVLHFKSKDYIETSYELVYRLLQSHLENSSHIHAWVLPRALISNLLGVPPALTGELRKKYGRVCLEAVPQGIPWLQSVKRQSSDLLFPACIRNTGTKTATSKWKIHSTSIFNVKIKDLLNLHVLK